MLPDAHIQINKLVNWLTDNYKKNSTGKPSIATKNSFIHPLISNCLILF